MSSRLVAGFVLLVLSVLLLLGTVRHIDLIATLRAHDAEHARVQADLLLGNVLTTEELGRPVDEARLAEWVGEHERFEVVLASGETIDVAGSSYSNGGSGEPVRDTAAEDDVTVRVTESVAGWRTVLEFDPATLASMLLLAGVIAAAGAWLMARWISGPFTQLAAAAAMLGRGRFDLDLPRTRVPEIRAVAQALEVSAHELRERLAREQQFAVHASHVLRTPLTSLRLHLDELATRPLDADAATATRRCQDTVEELDRVVSDLVGMTRRGVLMSGAEVPLREVAAAAAQQWADGLLGLGRGFSAAVEGDLDLTLTPGPIEYVLDVLLEQAQAEARAGGARAGAVRLVLEGAPAVVRLDVLGVRPPAAGEDCDSTGRLEQARSLVVALGGRMEPRPGGGGVCVLLPPR